MLPLQRLNHRAPLTESTSPAHEHTPLLVPFSSASVPPPSSPSPWEPLLPIAKQFQEEGWRHKFICRGPEGVIRLGSILKILGRAQENFPCPFLMRIDRRAPLLFPCGSPNRHSPALGLASKEKTCHDLCKKGPSTSNLGTFCLEDFLCIPIQTQHLL